MHKTSFNFLNPGEIKRPVLNKNGDWVEAIVFDYEKDYKKVVKQIDRDC
jgi:hypothetical protein